MLYVFWGQEARFSILNVTKCYSIVTKCYSVAPTVTQLEPIVTLWGPIVTRCLHTLGGPIEAIDSIVVNTGAKSAVRYMSHLIRNVSAGIHHRLEFFPSSISEMERCNERFVDEDIPRIEECPDIIKDEESCTEATENESVDETGDAEEDEIFEDKFSKPTL